MTAYQWFVFFLLVQLIHFLGTWKLYEAAGRKRWEAAVPVYNAIVLMKIIGRPSWWTLLLFIPIINLIMFPVIWVETLRSFGKRSSLDTFLGVVTCGFYLYYINYTQPLHYIADRKLNPENKAADTVSSLLFAIIVATFVHTYFIQPYTIPTSSLEKSLLIGDFLFVSKMNYGARVPMTSVALPMVHDSIPLTKKKSYLSWPQLPYLRLPSFQKIEKNDIVVFNWPADTVYQFFDRSGRKAVLKPIDKKSNYVKRCQGTPGDVLEIKEGMVYIDGKPLVLPERAKSQYEHTVYSAKGVSNELLVASGSTEFNRVYILKPNSEEQIAAVQPYVLNASQNQDKSFTVMTGFNGIPLSVIQKTGIYAQEVYDAKNDVNLTLKAAAELRKNTAIDSVIRHIAKKTVVDPSIFPHNTNWTVDNYGPITIPEAGKTVQLTQQNIPLYKRIIESYEGNTLENNGQAIKINGEIAKSYTFKQNYYWMMGDNRHRSEDSRYWGFVPEDHIVGKPVFIWMSWDTNGKGLGKIRWERLFTTVGGDGQPQSYFQIFLILLAVFFIGDYFWKKRKAKNSKV
ncbi:signal peptidase I [Flavobacterium nackdongense]|uniref:Signal peptidase I n=1 Tax=Flavobacterium nackdongense TaxID=2547394 RepID=A0A4P6YCH8_9FLAO|nr:signal peptidase I [Flavobacterium nackdongense]QBN18395.1 signal peptidase I [Flavobacterium nackdongense]